MKGGIITANSIYLDEEEVRMHEILTEYLFVRYKAVCDMLTDNFAKRVEEMLKNGERPDRKFYDFEYDKLASAKAQADEKLFQLHSMSGDEIRRVYARYYHEIFP